MIKKFSALFFAVFYLLISIGFSVSIHHCSGMNETSEALLVSSSCCCEIEMLESDCCTDEEKVIQWEMDQQIHTNFSYSAQLVPKLLNDITSTMEEQISEDHTSYFIEDPPPKLRKSFLLFHQFTFYG